MGVFTFVLRNCDGEWTGKQLSGDIEASASTTFEIQRKLVQSTLAVDSSGPVQSSFATVSPTSAVFQVVVGGAVFVGGAVAAAAPAAAAGDAPAAEAKKEEKKEEEEEEDEDMGLSLFD
ncbi:60S acidic ribosomal protein P3 [Neltuma alba]|uniref:60S acidic ribosomal protein P3 n=1 Tax=Neltuma alba TaxID=207710 RepID=UPI0010A4FD2B|nr:60S acidic ribosomal protein P3-like [Prosopis alba]